MRYSFSLFAGVLMLAACATMTGCGRKGNRFRLEGRIRNLNQGELYVYALDGSSPETDTIRLDKGRFVYEKVCDRAATLVIVFPNFSEEPLFVHPGGKATLRADATNMKELEVKGTDDNDAMTAYRLQVAHAAPPDAAQLTEKFITDHAETPVAVYLVRKHYVDTPTPDYAKAARLMTTVKAAQPHNLEVDRLQKQLQQLVGSSVGKPLPHFSLTTLNGTDITDKTLTGQQPTVILAFAQWSNEAMAMLRRLCYMLKDKPSLFRLVAVSLDGDAESVRQLVERENLPGQFACPSKMFDDKAVQALALNTVPDNIVVVNGKIRQRSLPTDQLAKTVDN